MQTFKLVLPQEFKDAANNIKRGNQLESEGKKLKEIGKAFIDEFLKKARSLNLDALPIGEIISINSGEFVVVIGAQNRFDVNSFALKYPELYKDFTKPFAIKNYKV